MKSSEHIHALKRTNPFVSFAAPSSGWPATLAHELSPDIIVRLAPKAVLTHTCCVHMQKKKQTLKGQNVVFGLSRRLGNGTWIACGRGVLWGVWVGVAAYGFSARKSCTDTARAIRECILDARRIQPRSIMAITIIHTSSDLVSQKTLTPAWFNQPQCVCRLWKDKLCHYHPELEHCALRKQ